MVSMHFWNIYKFFSKIYKTKQREVYIRRGKKSCSQLGHMSICQPYHHLRFGEILVNNKLLNSSKTYIMWCQKYSKRLNLFCTLLTIELHFELRRVYKNKIDDYKLYLDSESYLIIVCSENQIYTIQCDGSKEIYVYTTTPIVRLSLTS